LDNPRIISFDGASNFREVGGLAAQDGRTMKMGLIFRSDELAALSRQDLDRLSRMGLKLVFDLRTPNERKSKPDRLPADPSFRLVHLPIYYHNQDYTRLKLFFMGLQNRGGFDFRPIVKEYYCSIAFESSAQLKEVFTAISDPRNLPVLLHCTAGKDRTGFIAALLQLLSGVPRPAVVDDYLLTNLCFQRRYKKIIRTVRWMSLFRISPEQMQPVLEARPEYLEDILDEILENYGSIEDYLQQSCGLDSKALLDLQRLFF